MKLLIVVLTVYVSFTIADEELRAQEFQKYSRLRNVCNSDFVRVHCKDSPMITTSYWYNATSKTCEIKPNYFVQCSFRGNNFPSLASCEDKCRTGPHKKHYQQQNVMQYKNGVCRLPHAFNDGFDLDCLPGSYQAWSYDSKSNNCKKFTYTGCGGNANRFHTEKACMDTCFLENKNKPSKNQTIKRMKVFNNMKILHPVCRKAFIRHYCHEIPNITRSYWYNAQTNKCEKKTNYYLMCANLGNNFPNKWACERKCKVPEIFLNIKNIMIAS